MQLRRAHSAVGFPGCWASPVPGGDFGVLWPGGSSGDDAQRGQWWLCPVGMGLWWRTGSRKQRTGVPAAARCRSHPGDPSCAVTQCLHCCGGVTRWFWGGNVPWLMFVPSMPCPQTPQAPLFMAPLQHPPEVKAGREPSEKGWPEISACRGVVLLLVGGFCCFWGRGWGRGLR